MSLAEKINEDMKKAMREKDKTTLEALRAVKSALLLVQTEKGGDKEMDEQKEIQMLQKLVKQRAESAEIYKTQNRQELYEKEMAEKEVIERYLPEQMSEDEITEVLKEIITETGAKQTSDMGKVMGLATKRLAGKADNKFISQKVKSLLTG